MNTKEVTPATRRAISALILERDMLHTKIERLEDGLRQMLKWSDSEMRDGDAARELAYKLLGDMPALKTCSGCGEDVTSFCRGKVPACPLNLPTPGNGAPFERPWEGV